MLYIIISAWASTLLVQQIRAMRRPLYVGRATERFHVIFLYVSATQFCMLVRLLGFEKNEY